MIEKVEGDLCVDRKSCNLVECFVDCGVVEVYCDVFLENEGW